MSYKCSSDSTVKVKELPGARWVVKLYSGELVKAVAPTNLYCNL